MVVVRDVIEALIKQGRTLDQIKAASPAKPYETEYGARKAPPTLLSKPSLQELDRLR